MTNRCSDKNKKKFVKEIITKSSATAEIAHDVEMAIQGHSRSSVIMPINAVYMTSY